MAEFDFLNCERLIIEEGNVDHIIINDETVWTSGALSEGLSYALQEDNTYTVIGYEGEHDKVLIPEIYNDLPVTRIEAQAFYISLTTKSHVKELILPDTIKSIGREAFRGCESLSKINIPNGLTTIDDYAFWDCNLDTIILPASVTKLGYHPFHGCLDIVIYSELTKKPSGWHMLWDELNYQPPGTPVVWDYLNNDVASDGYVYLTVEDIRYALKDGIAIVSGRNPILYLEHIDIQDNITYKSETYPVTFIGSALAFNDNLKSVSIPYGITSIGSSAFYSCDSLLNITLPDSVEAIGQQIFRDCSSLQSVTLSKNITEIPMQAFLRCEELSSINIPDGVISIGENAFAYCRKLTNIIIPYGVTSIGNSAFTYCTSITSIVIPASVTSIGSKAFNGWNNTQTIYCEASEKPDGWNDKWAGTDCKANIVWGYKP